MTEEKKGVTNGPANSEMAPQEDGTKVPLTNEGAEVKFTSSNNPPNGDAKIDVGTAPTFSGMTKEELMKFADDPFWVRLRWLLFIVFWVGWIAMLVVAIVIIIHAPRCAAKETLEWVQESAMVQYDVNNPVDADNSGTETPEDVIKMATDLGMTTVYLDDLISPQDFNEINSKYTADTVMEILNAAKKAGLHVVTDFVPTTVSSDNSWYTNPNKSDFFKPDTQDLDFTNVDLLDALAELLSGTWYGYGVQGFLIANADTEELKNASTILNAALQDVDGAVVYGEADLNTQLQSGFNTKIYQEFLEQHMDVWAYYKYNPKVAESVIDPDLVQMVTFSLFMVPGTPILHGFDVPYLQENAAMIKSLSEFRLKESVQVGNMSFLVEVEEDVLAYTSVSVMKGTPGYAVAINMHPDAATSVNFTSITGVPEKGDNQLKLTNATLLSVDLGTSQLSSVPLGPQEGIIIQFVPSF